jgi:transposase
MSVAAKGSSGVADGKAAKGSDMLGSQRGHGVFWQICVAHLLRDAAYAIECGDTAFSAPFRQLLLRAIAIGRRREMLKDSTLAQYPYDLDRRLDRIMAAVPLGEPAASCASAWPRTGRICSCS